jgi:hypothetical protein
MHYLIASLPIIFYGIALVLGVAGVQLPFASPELSPLAQWVLAFSLGLISVWAGASHLAFTDRVAGSIGWEPSPFQHEVGGANLGIGLGAIAAAVLGTGAAWAIFFVAAGFLWTAAVVHLIDMVRRGNFAINNAGPIFWWDILTPLTLLIALLWR